MKKIFFTVLFICLIFTSCEITIPVKFENNTKDDITLSVAGYNHTYTFTVPANSSYYLNCNKNQAAVSFVGNYPATGSYASSRRYVINQYTEYTVNVKNNSDENISYTISPDYNYGTKTISAKSTKTETVYSSTISIQTTYNYYSINNYNGTINLIFFQ